MSDDLQTTIKVTVDASGVASGVSSAKRSLKELGTDIKTISDNANKSLENIGKGEKLEAGVSKATKAVIRDTARLEADLQKFGTAAFTGFNNISKSAEQAYIAMAGKGVGQTYIDTYIEKLKEAQGVQKYIGQEAAKASEQQAAATQKVIAVEEHYASLKSQHAAHNKAIADQQAKSLRDELALIESINDATLRMKASGRAAAMPSSYYEAKAGAAPSSDVAQAISGLKAQEAEQLKLNKAKADQLAIDDRNAKSLRDQAAAFAAFKTEVQNAELNLIHFGRAKSAAMLADKGTRLGFDPAVVQAELAALQKIEAANKAAFAAANPHLGKLKEQAEAAGTSVKGLSASLRNVPAQFTDIVVSLQGGQAPLTVLLQQGGQLKDMFGGTGNAVRALGGYVMGLVTPYTVLAAAVGTLAIAYMQGAAESEAYNKSLIMTGNAVGSTAGQLSQMAQAVAQATGGTVGVAAESLAMLAGSSNIASSQFEKITAVATQMERVAGVAIKDTVAQFAELGKEPVSASEKLNASTHYLTAEIYNQIKALEDQGDKAGAAALAQDALHNAMSQRIPALAQNLGILEKAWKNVWDAVKGAGDAMLNVGREGDLMAELRKAIAVREGYLRNSVTGDVPTDDAKLNNLRQQLILQEKGAGYEAQSAAAQKAAAKQAEASIALAKEAEKNASKQVQMEREIAKVREQYNNSAKSTQDTANYETSLLGIQKRFKETEKHVKATVKLSEAQKQVIAGEKAYADIMAKDTGYAANFTETILAMVAARDKNNWSAEKYNEVVNAYLAMQPGAVKAAKDQEKANKDLDKSLEKLVKDMEDYTEAGRKADAEKFKAKTAVADYVKGINDSAAALEFETSLMGQSAEARATAIEQNAIYAESLKKIADIMKDPAWGTDTAARDAAIVDVQVATATKAATASGRAALAEWNKTYDRISDGLTDALMTGGKEGAQKVRDLLVQELFSKPFQMVVQALISPVANAVAGVATSAISSVGSTSSVIGAISNLPSTISTLATAVTNLPSLLTSTSMGALDIAGLSMGPVGWAALAVGALAALAGGGETRSGAQYGSTAGIGTATYLEGPSGGEIAADAARAAFNGAQNQINALFKAMGSSAALGAFKAGLETSENGKGFAGAGGTLTTGATFGDQGDLHLQNKGDKTAEQAFAEYILEMRKATLQALQAATDLPKSIGDKLKGIDIEALGTDGLTALESSINQVIADVTVLRGSFDALPFAYLKGISFDAAAGLAAAADALDATAGNAIATLDALFGGFVDKFYTTTEKTALLTGNTSDAFGKLGITMPAVNEGLREWYRAEVERLGAMDLSVAANANAYAGALKLYGQVDSLATGFTNAADAAAQAAEKLAQATAQSVASAQNVAVQMGLTTNTAIAQGAYDAARAGLGADVASYTDAQIVDLATNAAYRAANSASADQQAFWSGVDKFVSATGALLSAQQSDASSAAASSSYSAPSYSEPEVTKPDTSYADALASIAKDTKDFISQIANVGKDSYTVALAKIKEAAADKVKELDKLVTPEATEAARAAARTTAAATVNAKYADVTDVSGTDKWYMEYQYTRDAQGRDLTAEEQTAADKWETYSARFTQYTAEMTAAMTAAGKVTVDNTEAVNAWTKAQTNLLNVNTVANAFKAPQDTLAQSQAKITAAGFNVDGLDSEGITAYVNNLLAKPELWTTLADGSKELTAAGETLYASLAGVTSSLQAVGVAADKTKAATASYQEAIWTALGDTASLKIRERENTTKERLAAGWTQSQIDNVYGIQSFGAVRDAFKVPLTAAQGAANIAKSEFNVAGMDSEGIATYINGILDNPANWVALEDGSQALTAAAQTTVNSLESLIPSFNAVGEAADAYKASMKGLADEKASLGVQLLTAQGDIAGAAAAERDIFKAGLKGDATQVQNQLDAYDDNKRTEAQIATINATKDFNRALLEAQGNSSGLEAFDKAVNDAALLAAGWTQKQIDDVAAAAETTKAATATKDFNRAVLEAQGNASGLEAFDKAVSDAALLAAGWTQKQIDAVDAASKVTKYNAAIKPFVQQSTDLDISALRADGKYAEAAAAEFNTVLKNALEGITDPAQIKTITELVTSNAAETIAQASAALIKEISDQTTEALSTYGMTALEKTLYGIKQQAAAWVKQFSEDGTPITTAEQATVDTWTTTATGQAMKDAGDQAAEILKGVNTELANMGKSDLDIELANIAQKGEDTKKSLRELGDTSTTSAAAVDTLTAAQTQAAITANSAALLSSKLDILGQIAQVSGDYAGAAAILEQQHAIALKELDPSLRAATQSLWDAQAAAAELGKNNDLTRRLLTAQGDESALLAFDRNLELQGDWTAAQIVMLQEIYAAEDAAKANAAAQQAAADRVQTWSEKLASENSQMFTDLAKEMSDGGKAAFMTSHVTGWKDNDPAFDTAYNRNLEYIWDMNVALKATTEALGTLAGMKDDIEASKIALMRSTGDITGARAAQQAADIAKMPASALTPEQLAQVAALNNTRNDLLGWEDTSSPMMLANEKTWKDRLDAAIQANKIFGMQEGESANSDTPDYILASWNTYASAVTSAQKDLDDFYALQASNQESLTSVNTQIAAILASGNQNLIDAYNEQQKYAAITQQSEIFDTFATDAQKQAKAQASLTTAFAGINAAIPKTREEFLALAQAADPATEAGRLLIDTLSEMSDEFQTLQSAAETALQTAISTADDAYAALERAVNAQKEVVQETIDDLKQITDSIDEAVKSLRGDTGANDAAAFAFINQALIAAQTTGYMPDPQELADAISTAMSSLDSEVFTSEADKQFAKLSLAGTLESLGKVAKPQLTTAEAQLETLNNTLDTAKSQLNALNGINDSVLSVADALDAFNTSITAALAAQTAATQAAAAQQAAAAAAALAAAQQAATTPTTTPTTAPLVSSTFDTAYGVISRNFIGTAGEAMRLMLKSAPNAPILDIGTTWDIEKITNQVVQNLTSFGFESEKAKAIIAWAKDYPALVDEDILHAHAIPGFAVGSNYIPRDMVAQIHQGEEITPRPYVDMQREARDETNALLARLLVANERLEKRLAAIEGSGQRTADATNGRPEMPMLVETV